MWTVKHSHTSGTKCWIWQSCLLVFLVWGVFEFTVALIPQNIETRVTITIILTNLTLHGCYLKSCLLKNCLSMMITLTSSATEWQWWQQCLRERPGSQTKIHICCRFKYSFFCLIYWYVYILISDIYMSLCRLLRRKKFLTRRGLRGPRRSMMSVKRRQKSAPSWRSSSSRENCLVSHYCSLVYQVKFDLCCAGTLQCFLCTQSWIQRLHYSAGINANQDNIFNWSFL